jgi:hypothetical protein
MSMFQRDPRAGVFLGGDRVSGQEIRDQNGVLLPNVTSMDVTKVNACSYCRAIHCEYCKELVRSTWIG